MKQSKEMEELREKLADIEHQRWSDWQKYMHSRGIEDKKMGEGYLCIPLGLVKHWERQINTPYSKLTEQEKESDREQVNRYLPLIQSNFIPNSKLEDLRDWLQCNMGATSMEVLTKLNDSLKNKSDI